jgi:hypothetical protein
LTDHLEPGVFDLFLIELFVEAELGEEFFEEVPHSEATILTLHGLFQPPPLGDHSCS